MIRNIVLVAFRSMTRQLSYSLINITGLSIGIACSLVIFLFVYGEWSYDRGYREDRGYDRGYRGEDRGYERRDRGGDDGYARIDRYAGGRDDRTERYAGGGGGRGGPDDRRGPSYDRGGGDRYERASGDRDARPVCRARCEIRRRKHGDGVGERDSDSIGQDIGK